MPDAAVLTITPNAPLDESVFTPGSYTIENTSSGGVQITSVKYDISTALFPGLVFDPSATGSSGNELGKPFTVDQNIGGISATSAVTNPYQGEIGQLLTVTLGSFDPSDKLAFSIDIDPGRVTTSDPAAGPQGKMNGLELVGTTVTVGFSDGTSRVGEFFTDGSVGGARIVFADPLNQAPTVSVAGASGGSGTLADGMAHVTISGGPANGAVRLLVVRGIDELLEPTTDPYEANRATNVHHIDVALDANGSATLTVDLSFGGADALGGGIFHFAGAAINGVGDATSLVSDISRVRVATDADLDADGDGLINGKDRFQLDAANGAGKNLAQLGSVTLDFASGSTPFQAGFTGVMSNGQESHTQLGLSGTVAGGRLSLQTTAGDANGALNTQKNGYQFGVDVSGVQSFTVETKVFNPFLGGVAAQDYRQAGLQIGAGNQDDYAKLVFSANHGGGGIEFLTEMGYVPHGVATALTAPLQNVAYAMLYMDVAKTATGGSITPRWTLHDSSGAQIGAGTAAGVAITGALLDAVQGDLVWQGQQSELAVGVIATSFGSSGPFTASWDHLKIYGAATPGLVVAQSGGSTAVTEGGATDTLTVALGSQPSANVTVTVGGNADVGVAPTTLSFTTANWNQAQTVTVTAVNDTLVEGPETASVTFATSSTDPNYSNLAVTPVQVAVTDNDTAPQALALNAGGPAVTTGGTSYLADQYFTGGNTFSVTSAIGGTTDDAVYQTERYGSTFSYAVPVANGSYSVTLKFAELWHNAPGQRVFDVNAEGALVVDDLDIFAAAGGKFIAKDVVIPVTVTDGVLNLQFVASVDSAKIDAIQIAPAAPAAPGLVVAQSGGSTAVTEGGATDTLTVALGSQPSANVTVTVGGNADVGVAPTTLSFTTANWSQAQTVTVTAVNDTLVEGPETASVTFATSSTDPNYSNLAVTPVQVAVTDNDTAPQALALNAGGPAVTTGGTSYLADQYFTGGNTFSVTSAIGGTTDDAVYQTERYGSTFSYAVPVANGSYSVTLKFAELWHNAPGQRVFDVNAEGALVVDDLDIFAAAGGKFIAKDVVIPVTVTDGVLNLQFVASVDSAKIDAIQIAPAAPAAAGLVVAQSGGSTAVTEGGTTDTLTVALGSQPSANVTVTVGGNADVGVAPTTLSFTTLNWNQPQTVTVTAVNDTLVEGPETASVTFATSSTDPNYSNLAVTPVQVAVTDNDTAPQALAVNAGGPAVTTGGTSYLADQYFTGGNTFSVTSAIGGTTDDAIYQTERYGTTFSYAVPVANGSYSVTLKFAELWHNAPGQRVFDVNAEGALVIDNLDIFAAAGGKFIAKDVVVPVTVTDGVLNLQFVASVDSAKIDAIQIAPAAAATPGLVVAQSGGSTAVTEGGTTDTFTVALGSQPGANVTVTVGGNADVGVAPTTLSFTTLNWNQPQTVTVTAVNDTLVEGPETASVTFATSSTDPNYSNLAVAPVQVAVTDNDTAAPNFIQHTLGGLPDGNYTSLQFGPDGRLYLAKVDGTILAFEVQATATGYQVLPGSLETIHLIKDITNFNDDGSLAPGSVQSLRQVTGILVTSDAANPAKPVLYVSSSDPRIGAGPNDGDVNLDTNSGVVSRLTQTAGGWSRTDLVRGLPRSEENHSVNGMALSADGHTMYLNVGGNTNNGAPSHDFAYLPEFAYSAAIVSIDLQAIDAMSTRTDSFGNAYKYDLPTLPPAPPTRTRTIPSAGAMASARRGSWPADRFRSTPPAIAIPTTSS